MQIIGKNTYLHETLTFAEQGDQLLPSHISAKSYTNILQTTSTYWSMLETITARNFLTIVEEI